MSENERLIRFVREVLGCGCPDEVFQRIERQRNVQVADGVMVDERIVIGGRLLIFVVRSGQPSKDLIRTCLEQGTAQRDAEGLNRFRLALIGDYPAEFDVEAAEFAPLTGEEKKAFLHIVPKDKDYA